MISRQERESYDQTQDRSGCNVAAGALALLFPLPPGEEDLFSFHLTPNVRHSAALIGERIELKWTTRPRDARFELVRKPTESKAELEGSQLMPDKPGVFVVRALLGPWQRDIVIAAWPGKELLRMGKAPQQGKADQYWIDRRKRLQTLANDPNVTTDRLIEALEVNADGCFGFAGSMGVTVSTTGW